MVVGGAACLTTLGAIANASSSRDVATPPSASARAERIDPPRRLSVLAGGDILIQYRVREVAAAAGAATGMRFDFGPLFAEMEPIVESVDLAICHAETPIGRPGAAVGSVGQSPLGGSLLVAPYELAAGLRGVGFDRCSTASNHSYDLGASGIASTIEVLNDHGITSTGTARTAGEAVDTVFDVNGVEVAHLSFTTDSNTYRPVESWRTNHTRNPTVIADRVRLVRQAGAEVVLVSLHVLKEQLAAPIGIDRSLVTSMTAQSDIDAVFMHGPHVVQPFEWVNDTPVWWSLGNFISQMGPPSTGRYSDPRTSDGLIARVEFLELSGGRYAVFPSSVAVCNDFADRTVRAASTGLQRPDISSRIRGELEQCLARTRQRVPDAR